MNECDKFIGSKLSAISFKTDPNSIILVFQKEESNYFFKFSFEDILWDTFGCWVSEKILGQTIVECHIIPDKLMSVTFKNGYRMDFGEKEVVQNVVRLNEIYQKC